MNEFLNQCDEACKAIEDLNSLKGGTLVIGASQTTGTYLNAKNDWNISSKIS